MLEDGLNYPFRGESAIGRILIGGVLLFLGIFILPVFAMFGYLITVLERTVAGNDEPPEFENWGSLITKGLVGWVITFVYSIVPYGILLVLLLATGLTSSASPEAGFGLFLLTMALFFVVFLIVLYLLPAALANYAHVGSIGAAFEVSAIKKTVLSTEYLVAMVLPLVVTFVVNIISAVLAVTVVGLLLVPFVLFYAYVAIFHMFGLAYRDVHGTIDIEAETQPKGPDSVPA